jgi:RNA polymerase sigma factor (sigma-70 family)
VYIEWLERKGGKMLLNSDYEKSKIFETYATYVFNVALLITRSRTLSDDITQETFLRFFKKYQLYDPKKPIEPWLYRITVNVTSNILRKQKWLQFWGEVTNSNTTISTEESFLNYEKDQELWDAVGILPLKFKQILVLHYYSGMKLAEIADILEIPLGTCKSRLSTALKKLRVALNEEGGIWDETHT